MNSKPDPVNNRSGHVAAVWHDITLIWGGYLVTAEDKWYDECDPGEIYCHQDGIWTPRNTHGEVPPSISNGIGEVVQDHFYVACGDRCAEDSDDEECMEGSPFWSNSIYRLDLNTWRWSKLHPKGTRPLRSCDLASWVSGDNIFLFGGFGQTQLDSETWYPESLKIRGNASNQLVYYSCRENSWNWPVASGQAPHPRSDHSAFSVSGLYMDPTSGKERFKSLAFIFGGRDDDDDDGGGEICGDLHILDLDSMRWEEVEREKFHRWPINRIGHSFNRISSKNAVLVGGDACGFLLKDCWLLNINKAISLDNEEEIWTRCEHHNESNGARAYHRSVKEPSSQRLWILGGAITKTFNDYFLPRENIGELAFSSNQKLKVLALETVSKNFEKLRPEIKKLPDGLRRAAEERSRRKYVIT